MELQNASAKAGEPTLAELLADPIVQTMMRADGVSAKDVVDVLRSADVRQSLRSAVDMSATGIVSIGRCAGRPPPTISPLPSRPLLAKAVAPNFNLREAAEALRWAKRALKEAEERFDHDHGSDPLPLIGRVRAAELRVHVARAALRRLDPNSAE